MIELLAAVALAAAPAPAPAEPCGHVSAVHVHTSRDFKPVAERAWSEKRWRERDPRTPQAKRTTRHRRGCARNVATRRRMDAISRRERREFKRYREAKLAAQAFGNIDPPGAAYLARLRGCESGGDYRKATGNGYWGAYQFDLRTWAEVGGSGLPSDASKAEQDFRAAKLWREAGPGRWPVCG